MGGGTVAPTGWDTAPPHTAELTGSGVGFGAALATGDVDGDGTDDLLVGSPHPVGWQSGCALSGCDGLESGAAEGEVFLAYGSDLASDADVSDSATITVSFVGDLPDALWGARIALADVDGDGADDAIIAAPLEDRNATDAGLVCVFLGVSGLGRGTALSDADFCFLGENAGDRLAGVAGAGDLDGDGADDLVVTACGYDDATTSNVGRVYVLHSSDQASWTTPSDLAVPSSATIDNSAAVVLDGTETLLHCDTSAVWTEPMSATSAGDVDGDGTDDVLVVVGSAIGAAHILFGRTALTSGLITDNSDRLSIKADVTGPRFLGNGVGVGDIDGDGLGDLAWMTRTSGRIYGTAVPWWWRQRSMVP